MSLRGSPFRASRSRGSDNAILEFMATFRELKRMLSQIRRIMTMLLRLMGLTQGIGGLQILLGGLGGLGMMGGLFGLGVASFLGAGFMLLGLLLEAKLKADMAAEIEKKLEEDEKKRLERMRAAYRTVMGG